MLLYLIVVEQAYKTLQDPEKKKIYQRIMREARERTEFERKKENKRRQKLGLPDLPLDTFESQYRDTCQKLFDEIDERKQHYLRTEESQRKRYFLQIINILMKNLKKSS